MQLSAPRPQSHDPRRLRELMDRAGNLARDHGLHSVLVGLAGRAGDSEFPSIVDFVESALRVDDQLFRLTRERVVLLLTDVASDRAASIVDRLLAEYRQHYPSLSEPRIGVNSFEVGPETRDATLKHVLPRLFAAAS